MAGVRLAARAGVKDTASGASAGLAGPPETRFPQCGQKLWLRATRPPQAWHVLTVYLPNVHGFRFERAGSISGRMMFRP